MMRCNICHHGQVLFVFAGLVCVHCGRDPLNPPRRPTRIESIEASGIGITVTEWEGLLADALTDLRAMQDGRMNEEGEWMLGQIPSYSNRVYEQPSLF